MVGSFKSLEGRVSAEQERANEEARRNPRGTFETAPDE